MVPAAMSMIMAVLLPPLLISVRLFVPLYICVISVPALPAILYATTPSKPAGCADAWGAGQARATIATVRDLMEIDMPFTPPWERALRSRPPRSVASDHGQRHGCGRPCGAVRRAADGSCRRERPAATVRGVAWRIACRSHPRGGLCHPLLPHVRLG